MLAAIPETRIGGISVRQKGPCQGRSSGRNRGVPVVHSFNIPIVRRCNSDRSPFSVRPQDVQSSIAREADPDKDVPIMVRGRVAGSQVQNRAMDIRIRATASPGRATTRPACF